MMIGQRLVITASVLLTTICAETILEEKIVSVVSQCKEGTGDCSPIDRGQFALCSSCSAFVVCGQTIEQSSLINCPEGQRFDVFLGICHPLNPIMTGCRQPSSPSPQEVTSEVSPTTDGEYNTTHTSPSPSV